MRIGKLQEAELNKFREIRIHRILNLPDNGRRQSMRCPIHNGKNPNFNLYPDNSYYCFKCGANGRNAIDFCMDLKMPFYAIVRDLKDYL